MLRRLAGRGHDVQAVTFSRMPVPDTEQDGVRVRRIAPATRIGNAGIHPRFALIVGEAIREQQPDVLVAHTPVPFAAEMAFIAARREGVPFVTTYHAGRLRGSSRFLDGLAAIDRATLERRMLAGSTRLIAVTDYVREHALRRQKERTTVIPPGVDHDRLCPTGPVKGQGILFIGPLDRSYRWKGVDTLWEAFATVRRLAPAAHMTLVGVGDRFHEFAQRAVHDKQIRLAGRLSPSQLLDAYRKHAVTVLPSTTDAEAFGMVLAEANSCGRPVIGSAIGGIPSFVRHGDNGLLANPGDPFDLAAKIMQVLDDPKEADRMGKRGRKRIVAEHDWDRITDATENLLREAAGFPQRHEVAILAD